MATSSFYNSSGSTPTAQNTIATSVTQAATSATQAATSATQASTSATNAQNSLNSFQQYYLGSYTTAPSTSQVGALYFNSTTGQLFVWSGTSWNVTTTASNISDTDDVSEGTSNLYFTNARAISAITGSTLDMGGNKVLFANMYSAEGDLPSATTYHGLFAHVHATGKGYFAHAGSWHKLLDETSSTTTDLTEGSNLYYTDERVDDRVNALLTAGSNITLTYDDAANTLTIASTASGGGGSTTFTGLTDTPSTMGTSGQYLAVNSGGTALEFVAAPSGGSGSSTFTGLSDTPSSFTASKFVAVNSGGTALEYATALTPSNLTVTNNAASGGGSVSYIPGANGATLSFIPPDLSSYIDLTDISVTTAPASGGGNLAYNNATGLFTFTPANLSGSGGIGLTDLSATNATASGGGSLAYNNTTGVFTLTPPDLSGYATTSSLSSYLQNINSESLSDLSNVASTAPSDGQVLTYDTTNGWQPETPASGGIALTDLSAPNATASGGGSLHYNNTTGVFTYTPPDLSSYITASSTTTFTNKSGNISQWTNDSGYLTAITGQSLYSLSNVNTSSSPTDGQVLTWDNANSYWKPTTVSSGSSFAGADYFKINPALVSAASATGSDAISIGRGASNPADYSVVLGGAGFTTSAADYGLAVGWNANVSAVGGQAIGTQAAVGANEDYSLALGYQAQATAANQLVLGSTNSSYGYTSILVGNASYTPSQSMDLTTKSYVDTAVAGAGGGGSSFAAADYVKVNSTSTAASATGTDGIAIGYNAQADGELRKISIGHRAGYSTTIGNDSISIGYYAGARNQQDYSVYIGRAAGQAAVTNTTGNRDQDVGIGYNALYTASANYSGEKNTGLGAYALGQGSLSSGSHNVAVGRYCGANLTTGSNNVFMGSSAASYANSPTQSIVIGYNAGYSYSASYRFVNNAYAILIGASTSCSSTTSSREIVIGQGEQGKGTNTFNVAAASGAYHTGNTSSWSTSSDERVKKNIADYTTGLTALNQINVKSFNYKSDEEIATDSPELANEDGIVRENLPQDKLDVGILAQELETVLPNCVNTRENGIKTVVKDELFWVMLNAIKELSAKNDALEARIVALENA